jgi:hypothetical protein
MNKYNFEFTDIKFFEHERGCRLYWNEPNTGFGQVDVFYNKDDQLVIDSECMGKEFVKALLGKLVDNCKNFG